MLSNKLKCRLKHFVYNFSGMFPAKWEEINIFITRPMSVMSHKYYDKWNFKILSNRDATFTLPTTWFKRKFRLDNVTKDFLSSLKRFFHPNDNLI